MFLVLLPPSPVRFLVLLFIVSILVAVGALNEEGGALLTFKGHVKKDSRGSFSNWNSSDPNPCTWNGITCKGERVIALTMPKQKLLGSLHPALGYLPHLRHVNLRSNRLYGNLPPELFRNSGLRSLVLSGNFLSGSLPSDIGKLSYLQILDVSQNLLNGSIPVSLLKCKRLRALDLSNNSFTGPLPTGIGNNLIALEKLDLSYNQFNGPVPGDIGSLVNLQGTVDLSHNGFSGSIPASLGNLPEMVYIDLSYNNLSGPIPQHGALVNRGPTAFIGNPGLCGPPLKNLCPSDVPASSPSLPFFLPSNYSPSGMGIGTLVRNGGRRGLSTGAVIAIVASDVLGICVISLLFLYCYHKATCARLKEDSGNSEKIQKISGSKECFCFRKDESGSPSENAEQLDLIPLDRHINFDLDELLKASAFVLGKSGIGIAYKVVLEDGLTLAVRRLGEGGSQRFKEFQAEVEAIAKVKHPNIVGLRAYYWTIDEKLLIYEYIPHGNLSTAIHGKSGMVPFSPMTWLVRVNIMRGVAKGLAFLHEFSLKKYVHGDLKPSNILLGVDLEPHISNFGLARLANIAGGSPLQQSNRIASEKPQSHSLDVGMSPLTNTAFCYHAPEAFKTLKPSQKWDVYSYGVILLELITGRPPIVRLGNTEMDLVRWVELCIEEKKSLSQVLDPYLVQEAEEEEQIIAVLKVALACVQMNPDRRPSMRNVLETLERF